MSIGGSACAQSACRRTRSDRTRPAGVRERAQAGWSFVRCRSQPRSVRDQGIAYGLAPAVENEQEPTIGAAFVLPPTDIGDRLVRVLVAQVVQVMVRDRDGQPIPSRIGRNSLGKGPRPEYALFLEAQIEVVLGLLVLVQHEGAPHSTHRGPIVDPSWSGLDKLDQPGPIVEWSRQARPAGTQLDQPGLGPA